MIHQMYLDSSLPHRSWWPLQRYHIPESHLSHSGQPRSWCTIQPQYWLTRILGHMAHMLCLTWSHCWGSRCLQDSCGTIHSSLCTGTAHCWFGLSRRCSRCTGRSCTRSHMRMSHESIRYRGRLGHHCLERSGRLEWLLRKIYTCHRQLLLQCMKCN